MLVVVVCSTQTLTLTHTRRQATMLSTFSNSRWFNRCASSSVHFVNAVFCMLEWILKNHFVSMQRLRSMLHGKPHMVPSLLTMKPSSAVRLHNTTGMCCCSIHCIMCVSRRRHKPRQLSQHLRMHITECIHACHIGRLSREGVEP